MNQAREQFYKSTEQYFLSNNDRNRRFENNNSATDNKKHYIKEGPFINSDEVDYR